MPTVLFTSALQRFLPVPSAQVTGGTIAEALAAVFASVQEFLEEVLAQRTER